MRFPTLSQSILCALALTGSALTATAHAGERAEVGIVKADGTIHLFENRFTDQLADGQPVGRLSIETFDGVVHVVRKARTGASCQAEALPLWSGARMISHSIELTAGDLVSVQAGSWWIRFECEDVTCSDHVTAVGNPPQAVRARCETPASLTAACPCRFPEVAGGGTVFVINACDREVSVVEIGSLSGWVLAGYIQYF